MKCPNCDGNLEEMERERTISVTLSGNEGDDELEADDSAPDVVLYVCDNCGYETQHDIPPDEDDDGDEDEADPGS
jgi:hypothetical protein